MKKWRGLNPLEKQVEGECDKLVTLMGWSVVRFSQARASRQTPGIPDRKYYKGSRTFWFECKAEGGKQRPEQKAFQEMCEEAGELYVLGGLEELQAFLNPSFLKRRA
jgi:hypothetical protein